MRQRQQAKVRALKEELRRRMHTPIGEQGAYLRAVLTGHFRYYGVPMNGPALSSFREAVGACGGGPCDAGVRSLCRGVACGDTSNAGSPRSVSVIPIRYSAYTSSPKVGAGCVSSACPDLWRESRAIAIPTPTWPQALKDR
jgi:hypothetical protein